MAGFTAPLVGLATLGGLYALLRPRLRRSETWKATVTPLASIIGSGFLVVAPLLAASVGVWAPVAMAGIVTFAYIIGAVVRFNIAHLEPTLDNGKDSHVLIDLERLSDLALGFAYVISVAFYLRLLGSFVLREFDGDIALEAKVLTTVLLVGIAVVAWFRGLGGLELLEETAVAIKLSIILGLFAGLIWFNGSHWSATVSAFGGGQEITDGWHVARSLAGMLLVVQGFETSRYLGASHDGPLRIRTMRYAQLTSAGIYVVFIALMVPLFDTFPAEITDTAILDAAGKVTGLLVPLVIIAAAASQLSAGIADTAGGGGLLVSRVRDERERRAGYVAVCFGAVTVVWATNVFDIIALASRAFALYYLLQAILAFMCAPRALSGRRLLLGRVGIGLVAAALAFVAAAGIPAG